MSQALTLPGTDSIKAPQKRKPGRPSKPAHAKRSRVAKVCLTEDEYAALEAQARADRLPVSSLIYQRLFTDRVPAIPAA